MMRPNGAAVAVCKQARDVGSDFEGQPLAVWEAKAQEEEAAAVAYFCVSPPKRHVC